jgi:hypothetical protein
MTEASAMTGHDDWGDPGVLEALTLLIESCAATGRLNATGWQVLRSVALRHLRNRLYVQAHLARRPEVAARPLGSPVVVTGLPRTATSLLHNLLAQDPRHRFLRLWEALHPVPPENGHGPDEAALTRRAETWLERFYAMNSGFRTIHPLTARGPEECDALLQNAFASQHFDDMFDAEAYSRWFAHATLDREYAHYALQLRVLSGDREHDAGRWVLKSPGHLGHLDSLLRALPGALVIHCHRDPAQAVPSYASLILTARTPHSDEVSAAAIGEQALQRCATALERALEARAQVVDDRFFDVSYPALVTDPLSTVARIYEWLGMSLDHAVEESIRRWLDDHPRDRHGTHRYEPENFELPADRVRPAFAAYLERFGGLLRPGAPDRAR